MNDGDVATARHKPRCSGAQQLVAEGAIDTASGQQYKDRAIPEAPAIRVKRFKVLSSNVERNDDAAIAGRQLTRKREFKHEGGVVGPSQNNWAAVQRLLFEPPDIRARTAKYGERRVADLFLVHHPR